MDADSWDLSYRSGFYLKAWDYRVPTQELVATIASLGLPRGATALDIGCGAGNEAVFMASCGLRTTGVDLSPTALSIAADRAQRAGVSVQWRTGSALALPVPDASVDFANDRGCFHHVAEPDRPAYAREVARVLRPGGRLLLRGCRRADMTMFVTVTEEVVDRFFAPPHFSRGPVLPITLASDSGSLDSNLVLLSRRG
jgi:ubiquinone/menaquinone biosynthesis C-methylase UbiE